MVVLDNISINIAVPYIMTAFGTDIEHAKWASIGFMIAATVAMPLSKLAERSGSAMARFECRFLYSRPAES